MATDTEQLVLSISADTRSIKRQLDKLATDMRATTAAMAGGFRNVDKAADKTAQSISNVDKVVKGMKGIGAGLAGIGAGALAIGALSQQLTKFLDINTRIQNSLKVTGLEGQALTKVYDDLKKTALENGQSFESLSQLYQRLALNQKALGLSAQGVTSFIGDVAVAVRASGASAESASAGLQQLAQALGSGRVQGDEFRSLMENIPTIMQAVADGLGVPVGALKQMAAEGQLTAQVFIDAFTKGAAKVKESVKGMELTIGQSMENITTSIIGAAGSFDKLFNASGRISKALQAVAEGVSDLDKQLANAAAAEGRIAAYKKLEEASRRMNARTIGDLQSLTLMVQTLGDEPGAGNLVADFEKLQELMQKGEASASDFDKVIGAGILTGSELGNTFAAAMTKIREGFVATTTEADRLKGVLGLIDNAVKLITSSMGQMLDATTKSVEMQLRMANQLQSSLPAPGELTGTPGGLTRGNVSFTPDEEKTFLKSRAATPKIAERLDFIDEELSKRLTKLFQILPSTARITSAARSQTEQNKLRADYEAGRGGLAAKVSRHTPGTFTKGGAAVDIGQGVDMATLKAAVDQVPGLENLKGKAYEVDKVHVQLSNDLRTTAGSMDALDGSTKKATTSFTDQFAANQKLIDQAQAELTIRENETLSLDAREEALVRHKTAVEAARISEELLNAAKAQGLAITPELTAQINAQSQSLAQLGASNDKAADAMQKQAQAAEQLKAAQEAAQQAMAQMATSFVSGFISDLRAGKSATEALANSLSKLADQLLDMALNALFKNMFGGVGGGGGILSGIMGGSFKRGGIVGKSRVPMAPVNPSNFIGAKSYARGGMPGMPAGAIPAYLHPGELVIPKNMVGKAGRAGTAGSSDTNISNQLGPVSIDMAGTGVVAAGDKQAKQFGENVRAMIAQEMVRESRPGGLLRQQGASR